MAKVTKNVVEVPDPPYTVTIELSQEESATRHANYACCYFHRIKGGIMTETSDLRERVAGLAREWLWNREHNEAGMTTPGELADAILAAVSAAAPESPEDPCAACGKPRREHRPGYSAYRCTFRDAAAPDKRALADEVEYRIRTAVALAKGGHSIEDEIAAGRARAAALAARPAPVVSGEVPRLSDDAAMDMWWTACDDAWAVPEYLPGEFLRLALAHMGITAADAPEAGERA